MDKVAIVNNRPTDPAQLAVVDGGSEAATVQVTVTNLGDEALKNLVFTDVTDTGPDVTDWECGDVEIGTDAVLTRDGTAVVLVSGGSIVCTGTLPPMEAGATHTDTVTVTGEGVTSGVEVRGEDPLTITAPPALARIEGQTWIDVPPLMGERLDPPHVGGLPDLTQTYPARVNGMIVKLFQVAEDGTATQVDETTTSLPDPIRTDRYWPPTWPIEKTITFPQLGGHYYFDDLEPGTYQVQFVIPETLVPGGGPGEGDGEHEDCGIDGEEREDCPTPPTPEPIFRAMLPAPALFTAMALTTLDAGPSAPPVTTPVMPLASVPVMPLAGVTTGAYAFTVAGVSMHADPATGLAEPASLAAGDVLIFDAGVFAVGAADLAVVKTPTGYADDVDAADPLLLSAGAQGVTDPLPVSVTVTNTADEPLTGFTLTDATLTGADVTGWSCAYTDTDTDTDTDTARAWPAGATLDEQLLAATLAAGESFACEGTLPAMAYGDQHADSVTIGARGQSTGRVVDQSDDFGAQVLPDPGTGPGLSIEKTASVTEVNGTDGNNPGDQITWLFVVTNTGDVTLTDVTVVDPKAGAVALDVTTLAPGESATGTASAYTITDADVVAGTVDNTAYATGVDPDHPDQPVESPPDDTTTAVVEPEDPAPVPALSIDKVAVPVDINGADGSNPGDRIVWFFVVTNTGAVVLEDVTVVDPKVGAVTLDVTTLEPGESATGSVIYTITAADLRAGKVENTAHATGIDPQNPDEAVESAPDSTVTPVTAPRPGTGGDTRSLYTGLRGPLARTGMTLTAALAALVLGSMGISLIGTKRHLRTARERTGEQE